jgi:hypothetical protein
MEFLFVNLKKSFLKETTLVSIAPLLRNEKDLKNLFGADLKNFENRQKDCQIFCLLFNVKLHYLIYFYTKRRLCKV